MPLGIHASPGNSTATWDKYLDRTLRLKFDLFWREKYFSRTWSFSKHINTMQKAFRNAGMLLRLTKSSRAYLLVFILMVWHVFIALSCPMYMFMFLFLISIQNSFQVSCFLFFFFKSANILYRVQSRERIWELGGLLPLVMLRSLTIERTRTQNASWSWSFWWSTSGTSIHQTEYIM